MFSGVKVAETLSAVLHVAPDCERLPPDTLPNKGMPIMDQSNGGSGVDYAKVIYDETSAGAAVLSVEMITGEADLKGLKSGTTVLKKGLGLLPGVLVDQHFLQRQRGDRLISGVVVVDPRPAKHETFAAGEVVAATGLRLSVLREGMTYSLK